MRDRLFSYAPFKIGIGSWIIMLMTLILIVVTSFVPTSAVSTLLVPLTLLFMVLTFISGAVILITIIITAYHYFHSRISKRIFMIVMVINILYLIINIYSTIYTIDTIKGALMGI